MPRNWEELLKDLIPSTVNPQIQNTVIEWDCDDVPVGMYKRSQREPQAWARNRTALKENERLNNWREYEERIRRHSRRNVTGSGRESSSKGMGTPASRAKDPETTRTISSARSTSQRDMTYQTASRFVGLATCTKPTPTMNHSEISLSRFEENRPLSNLKTGHSSEQSRTSTSQRSSFSKCWTRYEVEELLTGLYGGDRDDYMEGEPS